MAKIVVDNETGQIEKVAERFPSIQDKLFAKLYLDFLEKDFETSKQEGKESVHHEELPGSIKSKHGDDKN